MNTGMGKLASLTKEELVELYTNDPSATYKSVAAKLGCEPGIVATALKKHGVGAKKHIVHSTGTGLLANVTKEELVQLYTNDPNSSCQTVADYFGCCPETVRRILKKHGIPAKDKGRNWHRVSEIPQLSDIEWLKKELETKPVRRIAKELGTTCGNVSDRIMRHNLFDGQTRSDAIKAGQKKAHPNGRFGEDASNWRGGRVNHASGTLVYKPKQPKTRNGSYIFEHILVAEKTMGRSLAPGEIVHHINGNKTDNRPENLLVCTRSEHVTIHMKSVRQVVELQAEVDRLKSILDNHGIKY